MVTTLVSLLYFVMTLSMIIINSSNMSIHGDSRALFHPNGPGVEPAGGASELRAMGKLHMMHVLITCFIQILLWFVLVFPVYKKWCFFDVGMPISGKTKEQGIWQVIQRNSIIKSNFSAFFLWWHCCDKRTSVVKWYL